jgi:hypothetical protein
MPEEAELTWSSPPSASAAGISIPATVIDPEGVQTVLLTDESPRVAWRNELLTDPIPAVTVVRVEPRSLAIPLLSLPLFGLVGVALVSAGRRRNGGVALAGARVALALGLVLGPLLTTSIALPGSGGWVPSEPQARRLLAGLLPNVYRALEYRDEGRIYDRLSVTVTGDTLTEVYLQQRRALELEERGGAQARVEAVEVLSAGEVQGTADGFSVRGVWTVGGMVTHFGHRHFRQNRYDARIGIVAVEGAWKIHSIEVLEQERVK